MNRNATSLWPDLTKAERLDVLAFLSRIQQIADWAEGDPPERQEIALRAIPKRAAMARAEMLGENR
jgi:hypothetical protein